MSRLFLLAHAATFGNVAPRSVTTTHMRKLSRQERWALTFLVLSLVGGVAYLFIVNSLATAGFMEKAKNTQLNKLKTENALLLAEREERRSWDSLVQRLPELQLVETKKVEYLNAVDPVTASLYATPTP